MEIVENLKKAGFDIDRKMIHLSEPIKTLGEHSIAVKLMSEVVANVKVTVNSKA